MIGLSKASLDIKSIVIVIQENAGIDICQQKDDSTMVHVTKYCSTRCRNSPCDLRSKPGHL